MGSGKSSIGRVLARLWNVGFHDTDDAVVAATGKSIPELFSTHGEAHFRDLERRAVLEALREQTGVVALGGGATTDEDTQFAMNAYRERGGTVVFLDVSFPYAVERIAKDGSRPMIAGDMRRRWVQLMEQRRPVLEAVSCLRVLTDACGPDDAAAEIVRRLRLAGR
jgi:shikimate kinase